MEKLGSHDHVVYGEDRSLIMTGKICNTVNPTIQHFITQRNRQARMVKLGRNMVLSLGKKLHNLKPVGRQVEQL